MEASLHRAECALERTNLRRTEGDGGDRDQAAFKIGASLIDFTEGQVECHMDARAPPRECPVTVMDATSPSNLHNKPTIGFCQCHRLNWGLSQGLCSDVWTDAGRMVGTQARYIQCGSTQCLNFLQSQAGSSCSMMTGPAW